MKKIIWVITGMLLVITLLYLSYVHNYNGIDISHHNAINWNTVANDSNIKFVYIKATEGGDYKDDLFVKHAFNANKTGIHVGAYHYFRTNVSGKKQFENFDKALCRVEYDLIPVIDVECRFNDYSDVKQVRSELSTLISLFEQKYHYKPIIYYGDNVLKEVLPVTYSCDSWIRTMQCSNFVPIGVIKQIGYINIDGKDIDADYCSNLERIIIP